ncbi:hypothetical protein AGMMS49545_00350 [Betaproteobacteria bacterium]|nr:hypothetical protein AGMMS49545_00350 [Betaproteobacteria bacterium]GHU40780.1 hypothetical protein AGMMS50289_02880 [Betaproteobacteria bacterium]
MVKPQAQPDMKHNGVGQAFFGSDGVSPSHDGEDAIAIAPNKGG